MASEEPVLQHTNPRDTTPRRLNSAPPADNMSTTIDRPSAAIGQDGEQTFEIAGTNPAQDPAPAGVKVEPQSGTSFLQTMPANPSEMDKQQAGSPTNAAHKVTDLPFHDAPQLPGHIVLDNLRKAIDTSDLAKLEVHSEAASQVLDTIRQPMADFKQLRWLKHINKIVKPQQTRTIVAVAGATGAGKSSLINALLHEQKLLPTSGFRACTAVVTEISYNDSTDPQEAYRAEVEFISQDDWDSELNHLFGEVMENDKLSPAYLDANVEAGIAYAKIRAVYPDLTHAMIEQAKSGELAKREAVANVLGKTQEMSCRNAQGLYKQIRPYLDSNEKDTKGGRPEEKDMAYWPLIKVVKVYTRALVLKQGICLVDLPGIQDANAARSAVARKYMAQASAMWVVASIKRAVDDEAAKKLLGMSSRLQMKLDGMYSSGMSFICTHTDNFEVEEILEAFDENGHIKTTLARAEQLKTTVMELEKSVEELEKQVEEAYTAYEGLEMENEAWTTLQSQQNAGQQVYAPRIPAKRKRGTGTVTRRRRQQAVNDDSNEVDTADRPALTSGEIALKLADLNHQLQAKDSECEDMEKRLEAMKGELNSLMDERDEASIESPRLCVQKRNQHVREIVRADFSNGIKEIDEAGNQPDEADFDPSAKQRDYDELGRSLPVFCVSSKAYKLLSKKTKREICLDGFRTLDDTEVPLLQQHAMKLPEQRRIHAHQTFLHEFYGLLDSLSDWASKGIFEDGVQGMSEHEEAIEKAYLSMAVEDLKKDLDTLILEQKSDLDDIINTDLQSKSVTAIAAASKRVQRIVTNWSAKPNVGGWGIAYGTYKAICRRNGMKTGFKTSRDFNEDILEPFLKKIASGWEHAFSHSVPESLDKFLTAFCKKLRGFYAMMSSRPQLRRFKMTQLQTLSRQVKNYATIMTNSVTNMKASIQTEQREASRAFSTEIKTQMLKAYTLVTNEQGKGSFVRMQDHMARHVRSRQSKIYQRASERVMEDLGKIFQANREEVEAEARNIVDKLEMDFRSMISGAKKHETEELARVRTRGLLHEADAKFNALVFADSMPGSGAQHHESDHQQASADGMVDDGNEADEVSEEDEPLETRAMDTTL